jgi:phage-related protein
VKISDAILETMRSVNVCDSNFEPANLVDVGNAIATGANRIANAITPVAAAGQDATGGIVLSLTEAVMGVTCGLVKIADAIDRLASAVENHATH